MFLSTLWKCICIYNRNLLLLRKSFALVKHWKKLQIRLVPAHFTCFVRNYFSVWKIIHLHINLLDVLCIFSNNDNDVDDSLGKSTLFYFLVFTCFYINTVENTSKRKTRRSIQEWLVIVKCEWRFPISYYEHSKIFIFAAVWYG